MKNILLLLLLSLIAGGCGSIGDKSWGTAGSSDAFKAQFVETQTGTLMPQLVAGGGCYALLFQRSYMTGAIYPTMVSYSRRKSMWGMFSGSSTGNVAFVYIAGSGETPEQTTANLEAIANIVNDKKVKEKE